MSTYNTSTIKTKLGNFILIQENNIIKKFYPSKKKLSTSKGSLIQIEFQNNINNYLEKKVKKINFSCKPKGTSFQIKVWNEIKKIQYGNTKTYLEIAKKLKSSPRAIGNACAKNICLLLIPCHRVIKSNGQLGGFILGKKIKSFLIGMEQDGK